MNIIVNEKLKNITEDQIDNMTEAEKKIFDKLLFFQAKLNILKEYWRYIYINEEKTIYKISNHGRIINVETGKEYIKLRIDNICM